MWMTRSFVGVSDIIPIKGIKKEKWPCLYAWAPTIYIHYYHDNMKEKERKMIMPVCLSTWTLRSCDLTNAAPHSGQRKFLDNLTPTCRCKMWEFNWPFVVNERSPHSEQQNGRMPSWILCNQNVNCNETSGAHCKEWYQTSTGSPSK